MKKTLLFTALVAFILSFSMSANAQMKASGKDYKKLQKNEKVLNKDLEKKSY